MQKLPCSNQSEEQSYVDLVKGFWRRTDLFSLSKIPEFAEAVGGTSRGDNKLLLIRTVEAVND